MFWAGVTEKYLIWLYFFEEPIIRVMIQNWLITDLNTQESETWYGFSMMVLWLILC